MYLFVYIYICIVLQVRHLFVSSKFVNHLMFTNPRSCKGKKVRIVLYNF